MAQPGDGAAYLQRHGVAEFLAGLPAELQDRRPADPYAYIIQRAAEQQRARLGDGAAAVTSVLPTDLEEDAFVWTPFHKSVSSNQNRVPPLHICILIVGSQGDVQPFVAFGLGLKKRGHLVRIATHVCFRDFVKQHGLDYFPLKGDPQELMLFMVKHPDMVTLSQREIEMKKHTMREIYDSTYMACITPTTGASYAPDVIICNPPCNTHVHLLERLHVPLHIMFTMPWSETKDYRHPFACASLGAGMWYGNKQSYSFIDQMVWIGLSSQINAFRKETLHLPPVDHGGQLVDFLRVPQTYCMSPHLVPKPSDWGPHIDVVGFWFLDGKTDFKPEEAVPQLVAFLKSGPPPFYIGFGSIVVKDPQQLSESVVDGVLQASSQCRGVRAILHQGWARLGQGLTLPGNVFLLDKPVPHDWLFPQCCAVCHHGGAGTVAAGLRCGKPTIVIPFFGDQPFWGERVADKGVGPPPIPNEELTGDKLAQALLFCLRAEVLAAAVNLGCQIADENGVEAGVDAFENKLPLQDGKWVCEVWQSQRWYIGAGWCNRISGDSPFTEETGWQSRRMDGFPCPAGWQWDGPWAVDVTEDTDADGWMYGSQKKGKAGITSTARKRRWVRTRSVDSNQLVVAPPRVVPKAGMDSNRSTLVYLTVREGRDFQVHERTYLKMWIRRDECKQQKQRTKVVRKDARPQWHQTFSWFFLVGDIFCLRHYEWNTIRDSRLESYEVEVKDIDLHSAEPVWATLSDGGGQVLLQWQSGA